MDEADFEREGLLEDLSGEARAARVDLLGRLRELGVSVEELRQAVEDRRLAMLPAEKALGGEKSLRPEDIADEVGLDLETLARHMRAGGLPLPPPGEAALGEDELALARMNRRFLDAGLDEDALTEAVRTFGEAAARAAGATRTLVSESLVEPGANERDVALAFASAARELHELAADGLARLYALHLEQQVRADVIAVDDLEAGQIAGRHPVAICFADLVGFTQLGAKVPADELGGVAGRLADLASDVADPPVRLVKTIGDAAMLVAPAAPAMVGAALDLVAAAEREGDAFPALRAGIAFGPALHRWGDYYGHHVNLASRVCDGARPSTVLATEEVREQAREGFAWSRPSRHRAKGVRGPLTLYRCRGRSDDGDDGDGSQDGDAG